MRKTLYESGIYLNLVAQTNQPKLWNPNGSNCTMKAGAWTDRIGLQRMIAVLEGYPTASRAVLEYDNIDRQKRMTSLTCETLRFKTKA